MQARKWGVALGFLVNGFAYAFYALWSVSRGDSILPSAIWAALWGQADSTVFHFPWVPVLSFTLCIVGLAGAAIGLRWPRLSVVMLYLSAVGPFLLGMSLLPDLGSYGASVLPGLLLFFGLPTGLLLLACALVGRKRRDQAPPSLVSETE